MSIRPKLKRIECHDCKMSQPVTRIVYGYSPSAPSQKVPLCDSVSQCVIRQKSWNITKRTRKKTTP